MSTPASAPQAAPGLLGPVQIEKLIFGGQGLGHIAVANSRNRTILAWNVLPGESIQLQPWKKRRGVLEGVAVEIIEPSPERVEAHEQHYLSCSPWQVLSWKAEQEWKNTTALEVYRGIGKFTLPDTAEAVKLVGDKARQYGYRNKMEFSVTAAAPGSASKLSLAFFQRGRHVLMPINGCELAADPINAVANALLRWLEQEDIDADVIKSIIVRADGAGHVIAAVFVKKKLQFVNVPIVDTQLLGLAVYYSNPLSPASTPDQPLVQVGQDYLDVSIRGHVLRHGLLGFYQVNVPLFEKTLGDIESCITPGQPLLDLYGGVGSIGIGAGSAASSLTIVDSDAGAIEHAQRNVTKAGRADAQTIVSTVEGALKYITADQTVVVDPPRAGLHSHVVERLLAVAPPRIVYLSCNVSTQARDAALLSAKYRVSFARLYNFFPRTPHVEGLLVLERR